jgi:hypothetical protein
MRLAAFPHSNKEDIMAHTHEFDCVVCGAHFDDEKSLQRHNSEMHVPEQHLDASAPAEPTGNERTRSGSNKTPLRSKEGKTARYGSAGSGGLEFEPGPEKD